MLVKCKKCEIPTVKRVLKKGIDQNFYADEHGGWWNGLTCPTCFREIKRLRRKKLRREDKDMQAIADEQDAISNIDLNEI